MKQPEKPQKKKDDVKKPYKTGLGIAISSPRGSTETGPSFRMIGTYDAGGGTVQYLKWILQKYNNATSKYEFYANGTPAKDSPRSGTWQAEIQGVSNGKYQLTAEMMLMGASSPNTDVEEPITVDSPKVTISNPLPGSSGSDISANGVGIGGVSIDEVGLFNISGVEQSKHLLAAAKIWSTPSPLTSTTLGEGHYIQIKLTYLGTQYIYTVGGLRLI